MLVARRNRRSHTLSAPESEIGGHAVDIIKMADATELPIAAGKWRRRVDTMRCLHSLPGWWGIPRSCLVGIDDMPILGASSTIRHSFEKQRIG